MWSDSQLDSFNHGEITLISFCTVGGGRGLGELQSQSGHSGEESSPLHLPGTEPRSLLFFDINT